MDEEQPRLPTVAVIRLSDGHRCVINVSDFDLTLHRPEGEELPEPKRRGRPRKEQTEAMNGNG